MTENKLQIRAKVLSSIVNLQNNSQNREFIKETLSSLAQIQDKTAVLEILTKEFLKDNNEAKDLTISFLLSELTDKETLETHLFGILSDPKIKDSLKAKVVSILRDIGRHVNYEQYVNYFENPDEIIDADTTKLLENARVNPESQIDFLDFIHALPEPEKEMLLASLTEDYDGDNLANILIPIVLSQPYSELSQSAIRALGESKSYLAYPVLKQLEENIDDLQIRANIQKSLSLLKLSGIKEDITPVYYKKLLENSPVYKCLINFPDGHGNNGIIFSRKNEAGFIQMFALVINDTDGIIDCFGFNEISEAEFERILKKFYMNDRVADITPEVCKYFMVNAEKLTRLKFKEMSYEYTAWKSITYDISYEEIDIAKNLKKVELDKKLLKKLYDAEYFAKWFLEQRDSEDFKEMTQLFTQKKEVSSEYFLETINSYKNRIFSARFLQLINRRLVISSYLAQISLEDFESSLLFSLSEPSEIKEMFLTDILKKSVYEYFLLQKEKHESVKTAASIFTRRTMQENESIDIEFVLSAIKEIEEKWA